ncbi:MAG: AraC family transcriptional regulator [Paraglaciecola sp.]|uniref:helix-turn-helix domain-containing protein n=1 Tax=Paraglaciecola sp. TaxID=1920173 RepID=UPI003298B787
MQFISVIGVLCVFVLLILMVFLLTVKTTNKLANRLFAVFAFLTAINLSGWFVWAFIPGSINLETFRVSFSFLEMPVFYLYVLAICYQNFRVKWVHLGHTIPFVVANLLPTVVSVDREIIAILSKVQWLTYILLVGLTLRRYQSIYRQNYTNTQNQGFRWLVQLTCVFVVAGTLASFKGVITYTSYTHLFTTLQLIVGLTALSATTWFVIKALISPELFRGVSSELPLVKNLVQQQAATQPTNNDNNSKNKAQITRVTDFMRQHKPYLDPSLTLQKLALSMGMPAKDLSILINQQMSQHFFDFINRYRIEDAAKMLIDPSNKKMTVLEILYQVGFNSKSSFNTAFKNQTGLTPTEYRRTPNQ